MAKEKHSPRVYRSLAWRIAALTLALWILAMGLLTWCVACDMRKQVEHILNARLYPNQFNQIQDADPPGTLETQMIQYLGLAYYVFSPDSILPVYDSYLAASLSSDDWLWGKWDLQYGIDPAVIFYDGTGEPLIRTGDYLTFTYGTEESWQSQDLSSTALGYVALEDIPGGPEAFDNLLTNSPSGSMGTSLFLYALRLTGYFEGNEFHPTSIARPEQTYSALGPVTSTEQVAARDAKGMMDWKEILSASAPEDQPLVTIYTWDIGGYNCTQHSLRVGGTQYDTLADYLHDCLSGQTSAPQDSLISSVLVRRLPLEDGEHQIAVAIRCKPLQYACLRLVWVYLISLAVVGSILILLLRGIQQHYAQPLETMALASSTGKTVLPCAKLQEVRALEEHHSQTHQALAENRSELNRLQTALDYARDAEEKRKQLISNITHELKTPLAIIHSYAECLQEDISGEKQLRYLATIQEETERMDVTVGQMLDLSRLEAGKIRLASDTFSLPELTRSIADKLQPLFDKRGLQVHYDFIQEFTMTADEGRIAQVIMNLLSNAQKYASSGGDIRIRISSVAGNASLYIENTAPHLSDDALGKVWDSFYRADASRSTPGTGLGLSLVKSIVSLHGGTCTVRNIRMPDNSQGVEFGFSIPMK